MACPYMGFACSCRGQPTVVALETGFSRFPCPPPLRLPKGGAHSKVFGGRFGGDLFSKRSPPILSPPSFLFFSPLPFPSHGHHSGFAGVSHRVLGFDGVAQSVGEVRKVRIGLLVDVSGGAFEHTYTFEVSNGLGAFGVYD